MQLLQLNETYTNKTNKNIYYKVRYINALGNWQECTETLKPLQSITKVNPFNKVTILTEF